MSCITGGIAIGREGSGTGPKEKGSPDQAAAVTGATFGEVFAVGPWFATEFRCTYTRRRTGDRVDVRGTLFCETGEGKISEMRMYWERRVKE